tara:strand:+ start:710 stop:1363 length:654 start_codon:yes stop_codon:yes gene_type:complete
MLLHFKSILFLIKKTYIIGALFILCGCQHSIESLITAIDSFSKANMLVLIGDPNLEYDTRRKLFYDNTLFSGKLVSQTKKGIVLYKKEYRNGLLDGKSFGYYPSGKIRFKRTYQKGKKNGVHRGWYESGQKKFEFVFKKGLSEGTHYQWYDTGAPYSEINYRNGKPFGSTKIWRKDGKLRSNFVIRENGKRYGLAGIKRCTKIDTKEEVIEPYTALK